jgi:beta-galactosidase
MALPAARDVFAAEVQYWRTEPQYWRPILEAAKAAGLPGVSSYVPWEVHEIEKGRFDLDGSTDPRKNLVAYLDLVREIGLKLAYRPGPFVCNEMDYGGYPGRIADGDVGLMVLDAKNAPTKGYGLGRGQPSYLHPEYLAEVKTWFEAVDDIAKEYTAARGGPIVTVNLDNELSYVARDAMFGADYNPCVVGAGGYYHRWLERKYGDPATLPYRGRFSSFEEVSPPREAGDDVAGNLLWYFDWIECKEDLLAEYLQTLRAFHEECGLEGVEYYTNLNPHRPEGVPTNFRKYAEAVGGLVGYDFYRQPWLSYSGYSSIARVLKLMNATLPLTWSAEFMGGWWMVEMNKRVAKSHTQFMGAAAMANGCQALSWFMFHDRTQWGDSPVSEMGHRRENWEAVRDLLGVAGALPEWEELAPVADLGVVYCKPYMWHAHLGDPMPCADNEVTVGEPGLYGVQAGELVLEYEGLYRYAQQAGYTAAAVDVSNAPEGLEGQPLVWLAAAPYLDPDTAERLGAYVAGGGTLVLHGAWPRYDLEGRPLDFLNLGGAPAATAGEVVGGFVVAPVQQGRVAWRAGQLTGAEAGEEDVGLVAAIGDLLDSLIGAPAVHAGTPPLQVRYNARNHVTEPRNLVDAILHRGGGAEVLYLVNLHVRAVEAAVTLADRSVGALVEIGGAGGRYEVREGRATVDLDRKSARVFRVER